MLAIAMVRCASFATRLEFNFCRRLIVPEFVSKPPFHTTQTHIVVQLIPLYIFVKSLFVFQICLLHVLFICVMFSCVCVVLEVLVSYMHDLQYVDVYLYISSVMYRLAIFY